MQIKNLFRIFMLACICTAILFSVPLAVSSAEKSREIEHEAGIYYTIQKGDTLWDLSNRFYDSPALWPGLWNENNQIPNPHWIYPGERIRLYHQSGKQQIKLEEKIEKPPAVKEAVAIPQKEPPYYYYSLINRAGFFRKEPVKPLGTIFQSKDNKVMISVGDSVYIKPNKDLPYSLVFGKKYTVYRTIETVRGKSQKAYFANYGTQHYLVGVVEIEKAESDYFIANVIGSYRDIRVNDMLMPYEDRSPKIYLEQSTPGINGKVIVNEDRDRMFGDNSVAFIDKGRLDGIMTGQFYSVYYAGKHGIKFEDEREDKANKATNPIDFGRVLVILTEDTTSTVLVTYSEKDLYSTASVRTPVH